MGIPNGLVTRLHAAKLLSITPRTIDLWIKQGLIKQVFRGRKSFILHTEVTALGQIFNGQKDFAAVRNLAIRAYMKAEEAERKIREITELLGLETTPIDTDEESILKFYDEAHIRVTERPPVRPAEVMVLAKKLHGITDEYLRLVETFTCDDEPWYCYMELANYLIREAPRTYFLQDRELAAAYGYIEAARRHLRPVAYFYVRTRNGREIANQAFIGGHVTDDIIQVMFPH